jgi:hypothetical protein
MIRSDIYRVVRDLRQTVARAVPLGKGFACIRIRVTEREVAAQNVETDLVACYPRPVATSSPISW